MDSEELDESKNNEIEFPKPKFLIGTEEEKITMCKIVTDSGADYIKTSTGFSKSGATLDDIILFSKNIGKNVKIKAAGGISSLEDAERFIEAGASRLGTSRIVKIVSQMNI